MGMIEPGNSTEFRRGRMEMTSGTSTGPSGTGFLVAMVRSYTREAYFASQAETLTAIERRSFRRASAVAAGQAEARGKVGVYLSQEDFLMRLASSLVGLSFSVALCASAHAQTAPRRRLATATASAARQRLRGAGDRRSQSRLCQPGDRPVRRASRVVVRRPKVGRLSRTRSPPDQRRGLLPDRRPRGPPLRYQNKAAIKTAVTIGEWGAHPGRPHLRGNRRAAENGTAVYAAAYPPCPSPGCPPPITPA